MVKMEKTISTEGMTVITHRLSRQSLDEDEALPYSSDASDSGSESDKENSSENGGRMSGAGQLTVHQPLISITSPVISTTKRPFQPLTPSRQSYNNLLSASSSSSSSSSSSAPHPAEFHFKLKSLSSSPDSESSTRSSFDLEARGTGDFMALSWGSSSPACMELDGYSSEDELASINCDNPVQIRPGGKRTWSKVNCNTSSSGIWSDDGQMTEAHDSPLNFSASPPKGVRLSHTMSPKLFMASALPSSSSYSPCWKKPR